jgi:hypothetical protein
MSCDSSVGIATDYELDDRMIGVRLPAWAENFLFDRASRPALGPTQPPIHWVPNARSLWVKRPQREADYPLPSSADVEECVELYLHCPNTSSWCDA